MANQMRSTIYAVLDTSVVLHCQDYWTLPWTEALHCASAVLVVLPHVLKELDVCKTGGNEQGFRRESYTQNDTAELTLGTPRIGLG
jgi:hypothetical protein